MFSWWRTLEFVKNGNEWSLKQIVKFLSRYVLPAILAVILVVYVTKDINFRMKDMIINLIIINSLYLANIHIYVQKKFFMKLDSEIIIKFIPNKANDYIIIRLFMIFIKAYLPVITSSTVMLGLFFMNSMLIFYLCTVLLIVSAIIINVLIAVYWRYFINTSKTIYVKIGNFIFFVCIFIVYILISWCTPIWLISNLEASLKHNSIRTVMDFNVFVILMFLLIDILAIVILKYSKDYFKVRVRLLIFNREFSSSIYKRKLLNKIEKFYQRVYSIYLSALEKDIFNKDVKEIIRENKYSFLFVIIFQTITIAIALSFNFLDQTNTIENSILISKLVTVMLIGPILISAFISKTAFEKNIKIENDFEVLKKYNIKFTKNNVIKAKIRILEAIIFPKIYLIFFILILISIIQFNNYLALIYLLSMIQLVLIKKIMGLWQVKSINGLSSKSEVIKTINFIGILAVMFSFVSVYKVTDKLQYFQGQLVLIIITTIVYIFHLTVNNARVKGNEGKV